MILVTKFIDRLPNNHQSIMKVAFSHGTSTIATSQALKEHLSNHSGLLANVH